MHFCGMMTIIVLILVMFLRIDFVCDRSASGLGFRNIIKCNIVGMGKYVLDIATKQDNEHLQWSSFNWSSK